MGAAVMTVFWHTLIAVAVTVVVALVTGIPALGGFVGAIIYPIREGRQFLENKGYGFAAWAVPCIAAIAVAAAIQVTLPRMG